jgi:iron(III) transport system permease protein
VLITLTLVLPGSTVAIGMLLGYGRWLADTVAIILLAYLAKLWALAHRPISASVDRLPPAGLRAARASGANLATGLATVALPLIRPALITAWALCFLTALHEVTMSSLLYGPGSETLAVVVLNSADLGRVGVTAALSVLVTVVVLLPAAALWALTRRARA